MRMNAMKSKTLSLLLVFLLVVTMIPVFAVTAYAGVGVVIPDEPATLTSLTPGDYNEVGTYEELATAVASGGGVKLINDIVFGDEDGSISVAAATPVAIDLNGHVITGNQKVAVFEVAYNGYITIEDNNDSAPTRYGYWTKEEDAWTFLIDVPAYEQLGLTEYKSDGYVYHITDNPSDCGGALFKKDTFDCGIITAGAKAILSSGTVNLKGGAIAGNQNIPTIFPGSCDRTPNGGGICTNYFVMSGGYIAGNITRSPIYSYYSASTFELDDEELYYFNPFASGSCFGGGVYVDSKARISDGSISHNSTEYQGSAILAKKGLELSGGTFEGNFGHDISAYCYDYDLYEDSDEALETFVLTSTIVVSEDLTLPAGTTIGYFPDAYVQLRDGYDCSNGTICVSDDLECTPSCSAIIKDNYAAYATGIRYSTGEGGNATISGITFSGNKIAIDEKGIMALLDIHLFDNSSLDIHDCEFINNDGGNDLIYIQQDQSGRTDDTSQTFNITDCVFSGNHLERQGSLFRIMSYNSGSNESKNLNDKFLFTNCTFGKSADSSISILSTESLWRHLANHLKFQFDDCTFTGVSVTHGCSEFSMAPFTDLIISGTTNFDNSPEIGVNILQDDAALSSSAQPIESGYGADDATPKLDFSGWTAKQDIDIVANGNFYYANYTADKYTFADYADISGFKINYELTKMLIAKEEDKLVFKPITADVGTKATGLYADYAPTGYGETINWYSYHENEPQLLNEDIAYTGLTDFFLLGQRIDIRGMTAAEKQQKLEAYMASLSKEEQGMFEMIQMMYPQKFAKINNGEINNICYVEGPELAYLFFANMEPGQSYSFKPNEGGETLTFIMLENGPTGENLVLSPNANGVYTSPLCKNEGVFSAYAGFDTTEEEFYQTIVDTLKSGVVEGYEEFQDYSDEEIMVVLSSESGYPIIYATMKYMYHDISFSDCVLNSLSPDSPNRCAGVTGSDLNFTDMTGAKIASFTVNYPAIKDGSDNVIVDAVSYNSNFEYMHQHNLNGGSDGIQHGYNLLDNYAGGLEEYCYLTGTEETSSITVESGKTLSLCLNGCAFAGNVSVESGGVLNIVDCEGGGKLAGNVSCSGSINYYGGYIENLTLDGGNFKIKAPLTQTAKTAVTFEGEVGVIATSLDTTMTEAMAQLFEVTNTSEGKRYSTYVEDNQIKAALAPTTEFPASVTYNLITFKPLDVGQYYIIREKGSQDDWTVLPTGATMFSAIQQGKTYIYYAAAPVGTGRVVDREHPVYVTIPTLEQAGQINMRVTGTAIDPDVYVSLQEGSTIRSAVKGTLSAGHCDFNFMSLPNGVYNLVVTCGNYTETKLVEIKDGNVEDVEFVVTQKVESVVVVKGEDTANVAAAGIHDLASAMKESVSASTAVKVELDVTKKDGADAKFLAVASSEGTGNTKVDVLDLTLKYFENDVFQNNITDTEAEGVLITAAIPYDTTRKDITAYRQHGSKTTKLTKLDHVLTATETSQQTTPPAFDFDGCYAVGDGYVYIYTTQFSNYAIGYTEDTTTPRGGRGKVVTEAAITAPAITVPDLGFKDVQTGDYFYDAVAWAVENGVTSGTDATHFSPLAITTRAQMVTFLWRAAGCPEPTSASTAFVDLTKGSYYEKAVLWGVEQGIVEGIYVDRFAPDATVTRGQAMTFIARFAGHAKADGTYFHGFKDVKATDYYNASIAWAASTGIASGVAADEFAPNADCQRGQVVTFLYRYFK